VCGCISECACVFFFSSRRRHTRLVSDWSSDVCSSDLFEMKGDSIYPDATFTLRLAFGAVKGYEVDGKDIPPYTTMGGAFAHARRSEERRVGKEGRARWSPDQ